MLVMSASEGERIYIGPLDNPIAVIEVVAIRATGKVRLGFTATKDVLIARDSLAQAIKADGFKEGGIGR